MSRDMTEEMAAEVVADELSPILIIKAKFDSGDLDIWSGIGTVTWNGDEYTGAGDLLTMSEMTENNAGDAQNATFSLTGINSAILAATLTEEYQGRPVSAWFGSLDAAGRIIGDPFMLFKGLMDVFSPNIGGQTMTLAMSCESRSIDISRVKEKLYTSEAQKALHPGDLGLDFVAGLQDAQITWGRPSSS